MTEAAERAGWEPPTTITAVLVPSAQVRPASAALDARTLVVSSDLADSATRDNDDAILFVPDVGEWRRPQLLRALDGREAVVGPSRPWTEAAASYERARRSRELILAKGRAAVDADAHLATLLVHGDQATFADLRRQALAPLADLRQHTADRLELTLRSWLLHQGRRDDVAADLMVHPQTVRYRMTQLRDLYGDRLSDPKAVFELVIALGGPD